MAVRLWTWLAGTVLAATLAGTASAQPADKADRLRTDVLALSKKVDALINGELKKHKATAAEKASDGQYFRRLNMDLVGRIPQLLDIDDFLSDDREDKRWHWAEKFIDHDRFAEHWANVFRAHMLGTNPNPQFQGSQFPFESFLRNHLKKNTGYHQIVREILLPFNQNQAQMGFNPYGPANAQAFYFMNENKPENLAAATTRVFLGVKLECAQCHPHPFAKWTQTQFWEFAAFFTGQQVQQFRQVPAQPNPMPFKVGEILIPGTKKVVKATFLNGDEPKIKQGDDPRQVLADWVVSPDNPYFAKATVDFVWSYFFGVSLLEPILEPSDDSPITHPELLDLLAREFAARNFDVKFLIRTILHTDAYQRSSGGREKATKEDYHLFARMPVRGLTPEQIFDSLAEATDLKPSYDPNNTMRFNPFQPGTPRGEFFNKFTTQDRKHEVQTSILQALFMMNGNFMQERLSPSKNEALRILLDQPTDNSRRLRTLYMIVLSRQPRDEELQRTLRYVDGGGPARNPRQALIDVYWALLNSGEFLLNH